MLYLSEDKALMTLPGADRDLLIWPASFRRSPWAWVSLVLSDPAKSMILKADVLLETAPEAADVIEHSITVDKTEWDLELSLFILVAPTCLFLVPFSIRVTMSS